MGVALAIVLGGVIGAGIVLLVTRASQRRDRDRAQRRIDRASEELRAVERTSAERRNVQDLVLDSMEEGVLLVDGEGRGLFSNAALGRHLGSIPATTDAIRPLELQAAVREAADGDIVARREVELGSPSRWLRATALPIQGDGVLLVVRDITEAKRINEIRRDFVANASHELKTPVSSIRAAAETLRSGAIEDPPAARRFTEQLERESIRLSRIVADLLDLSRLETGSERDERVRLDLVVADEVERLTDAARARGIELRTDLPEVSLMRGSGRDLALLARNLIDNAVRYTAEGGTVDVQVADEHGTVVLRVRDTGAGIPQRDLPRIFERFYRVDQARSRETGGTGLGLAIVRHVCENHGGEIRVTSELGRGSTFEARLPTAGEPAAEAAPKP